MCTRRKPGVAIIPENGVVGTRVRWAAGDPAEQVGGGRRIVRERQLMGSLIRLRAPVGAPPTFERTALYRPLR
jgi:hypothetical protein